jgi:(2R)-3-sulfolactate dehydrogenase (NADP+)
MTTTSITAKNLESLITRALVASNTSAANAASVARALTNAEIDGQKGHGVSRVSSYAAQARAGKVDGHATPKLKRTRTATLMVDVANGFAYPALDLAIAELPAVAAETGIAAAGFVRSHHYGVAGHHVERLSDRGLIALTVSNTPQAMASWGGKRAVLGTNPIAFAAPRRNAPPLVIDMALSEVARGKIVTAAQKGEPIPLGWAVDADGNPTTDAKAALAGTLVPAGGAKGAALALMVETLAVALTGANFAFEASSFLDANGPPPGAGQLLIAIDPGAFAGAEQFANRFAALAEAIESDEGARLPGSRRVALRKQAQSSGINVDAKLLAEVQLLATAH